MSQRQHSSVHETDKKTVDLCGHPQHTGGRCVRERGHTGKHECLELRSGSWVTWE